MINKINDYTNRLNKADKPEVQNLKRMNDELQYKKNVGNFQELLKEEVGKEISGKLSSSSVQSTINIKEEIEKDAYRKRLYNASVEFESIFVKMMLNQMKKSVQKSGLIDGGYAEEIFEDMLYDEYARMISSNEALGLAEQVYTSLSKALPPIVDKKI
ncbi:MAG: rod-binding protein [Leptospiraceae bacterium]|nr:rod-binding protein [Leptospiraceae bacterium]MCP5493269.1 rod-binding protein [Leptospiraceae bacterium]